MMKRKRSRFDRLMLPTLAAGAMVAGMGAGEAKAVLTDSNIWINEFHYDNTGTDANEFIEVVAPSAFTSLSDITLTLYNGANGQQYGTPTTLAAFAVGATVGDFTFYSLTLPSNGIQNGNPDGFSLTNTSTNTVLMFLSYGGTFSATNGLANGLLSTDVGVTQSSSGALNSAVQLQGTGNSFSDFSGAWTATNGSNTKGALNTSQTLTAADPVLPPPPPPPTTADVLPGAGQSLTFDFNTFTASGFAPAPTAGQLDSDNFIVTGFDGGTLIYGGTQTTGDFARGSSTGNPGGSSGAGGVYAFNHGGGDIGLGIQPSSNNFVPGNIDLRLQNTTGSLINDLLVEFEVWVLNNEGRSSEIAFSFSTDGLNFTDVPSALVITPVGADTAPAWQLSDFQLNLSALALADNAFLFLRWSSDDASIPGSGSRDEFAIDNIVITNRASATTAVPEPVTFSMLVIGGVALMTRRQRIA